MASGEVPKVLEVRNLATQFRTEHEVVRAVNGVSFSLDAGESLAIVGESGSGKSVCVLSIMGLISSPAGHVEAEDVILNGRSIFRLSPREYRRVRGSEMAMVFQDPMTSLNPVLTVGYQLTESLREHRSLDRQRAREKAVELLDWVGIPNPHRRLKSFPHQFSGGQRQRIMIAMALSCDPSLLIADEPTTALDVTIQAQIVQLIKELQRRLGMAIIWITHDLALVAGLVDRVAVMYAGHIVEEAPVRELFANPLHPYTLGLLGSMPRPDGDRTRPLRSIEGLPPDLRENFRRCPFSDRCTWVEERCRSEKPPLVQADRSHQVACWRADEVAALASESRL